jgi:hypothetical protein
MFRLKNKKKFLLSFIFIIFSIVIISNQVIATCPQAYDTPHEYRGVVREIIFEFLSDPSSSSFDEFEIKDMVKFYKDKKREKIFKNCDSQGKETKKSIKDIVQKKINKD